MNDWRKEFLKIANTIKRPGNDKLLKWLDSTDFYEAPASTKYHGNEKYGLVLHCLDVYDTMMQLYKLFELNIKEEDTIKICALYHDFCKVNFYMIEQRNKKIDGQWQSVPVWTVKDQFPMGHGEKSVYLINKYIELTDVEALAIRWHLGAYDPGTVFQYPSGFALGQAMRENKLVALLVAADFTASYLIEEVTK